MGGVVCWGHVGPRRSVDSLREPAQLSLVGLLADSLLPNDGCGSYASLGEVRARGLVELVGRCGAEGAELRHLPGRERVWHRRCGAA